jgi:hypothetical protein
MSKPTSLHPLRYIRRQNFCYTAVNIQDTGPQEALPLIGGGKRTSNLREEEGTEE